MKIIRYFPLDTLWKLVDSRAGSAGRRNQFDENPFGSALSLPVVLAQAPQARPLFEIADVHTSPPSRYPLIGTSMRAGRYEIRFATMTDLVAAAYGVEPDKVLGGPNWLDIARYDIVAAVPPNSSPQTIRIMLQSLLADRFSPRCPYRAKTSAGIRAVTREW
jgi:Protein of unknown function (DUF3738)